MWYHLNALNKKLDSLFDTYIRINTSSDQIFIHFCKRGYFRVGVIFTCVRLSRKLPPHKNYILFILLWKLHWYTKLTPTCNVCLTFSRNPPPAVITTCTVYVHVLWEIDTRILYDFDGCGDYLILKGVRLAVVPILFISKFWKLILIGFVVGFTIVQWWNMDGSKKKEGGGVRNHPPFVEVWIIKSTFQAKLRKYWGVFWI